MGKHPTITNLGVTRRTKAQIRNFIGDHFRPGTYDLCQKNCNSWTDAALYFLLQKRLPSEYRFAEQVGSGMSPSAAACCSSSEFDIEALIHAIDSTRVSDSRAVAASHRRGAAAEAALGEDVDERLALQLQDSLRLARAMQNAEAATLAATAVPRENSQDSGQGAGDLQPAPRGRGVGMLLQGQAERPAQQQRVSSRQKEDDPEGATALLAMVNNVLSGLAPPVYSASRPRAMVVAL